MIEALITPRSYRYASLLATPVIDAWLAHRRRRGKEDHARFGERLGRPSLPRPDGRLVWMHGASVGESLSLLPLVARLREAFPDVPILITSGTVTSAQLLRERLPAGVQHQFVPVDRPGAVRRFLQHWRPDLSVWVESELWPNLILETAARGTPMLLLNGRLSRRSAARWRRAPKLSRPLLAVFDCVLAQTDADAERFRALGARNVTVQGNLKNDAPPLPADEDGVAALSQTIGARPCWAAASTHEGEEAMVAEAISACAGPFPTCSRSLRRATRSGASPSPISWGGMISPSPGARQTKRSRRPPPSISSIRWATLAWSTASPRSPSSAVRWRPMAGTIRWNRRGSIARS